MRKRNGWQLALLWLVGVAVPSELLAQDRYYGECDHPDHGGNGMMAVYYGDYEAVKEGCDKHVQMNPSHKDYCHAVKSTSGNQSSDNPPISFDSGIRSQPILPSGIDHNDNATITVHCYNPAIDIIFPAHGIDENGDRHAVSQLIQINVNVAAKGGALYTDARNNAVCDATINAPYAITRGFVTYGEGGSWTKDASSNRTPGSVLTGMSAKISLVSSRTINFQMFQTSAFNGNMNARLHFIYFRQ